MVYKEEVDKDSTLGNLSESTASVWVNNNINDYEGNIYEKIMLNTYKALNYISLNDFANARVEFNRALDRQRRAKDFFEQEIKEISQKRNSSKKEQSLTNASHNRTTHDILYNEYKDVLNGFQIYPDFVNPFTTYMAGIYFFLSGDTMKSRNLLKESLAMDSENKQIKSDYELANNATIHKDTNKKQYAWVIYENGESMIKKEFQINIPIFLFTSNALYSSLALTKIKERGNSYSYLRVNEAKTIQIANMDNIIKSEFKKRFPSIMTEAVLNMALKTWTKYELNKQAGALAGIVGEVYQLATNKADVRTWTALPKNFQSIRVLLDNSSVVVKDDNDKIIKVFNIPKNQNALIYVRSQARGNHNIHLTLF